MAEDIKDQETTDEGVDKAEESVETAASPEADATPATDAPEDSAEQTADAPSEDTASQDDTSSDEPADVAPAGDAAPASDAHADEDADEAPASEEHLDAPQAGGKVAGVAAFFDHPEHLIYAASKARDAKFEKFDAFSPFPIHGMDDAMGLGRSWIPWVTFAAGCAGLTTAASLQFGIMGFDWPMIYGGRPFIAWPSFVPIMFELTVLFAGVTTGIVMLIAAGCFRKPIIIDRQITNDRFALWIAADDKKFDRDQVVEFMKGLNPTEIRTVRKDGN